MARRPISEVVRCAEDGCRETAYYEHASQREAAESRQWRAKHPYRCLRHTRPGEVLTQDGTERVGVLTVYEESYGKFWRGETDKSGSGSAHGPGFKAFAKDFPAGTRLVVTARIEPALGVCEDPED
jgi:hypothetical protein